MSKISNAQDFLKNKIKGKKKRSKKFDVFCQKTIIEKG